MEGGSLSPSQFTSEAAARGLDPNDTGETVSDPAGEGMQRIDTSEGIRPGAGGAQGTPLGEDEGGAGSLDPSSGIKAGAEQITDPVPDRRQEQDSGVQKR